MSVPDVVRLRQIRGLALIIGALSVVVVAVSAYLRLEAAGLGCVDWPACYGRVLTGAPPVLQYGAARLLHRLAASAALVLALVMIWRCLRPTRLVAVARPAALLLALMLSLSVLGFFSADPRRSLVAFLNIVGGLGLVTFSWRVAMAANGGQASGTPKTLLFHAGVLTLSIAVALGAWIGATYSSVACLQIPWCPTTGSHGENVWLALNPLRFTTQSPSPGDSGGAFLSLLHRGFALLALAVVGFSAWSMRSGRSAVAARAVMLMLPLVFALGAASVASGLGLWLVVLHGTAAALLLAAVASLMRR